MHSGRMCTSRSLTASHRIPGWSAQPNPPPARLPPPAPSDADPPRCNPPMDAYPPGHVTCDACWEATTPCEQNDRQVQKHFLWKLHLRAVNILSFYYNDEETKIVVSPLCEVSLFIGTKFTTATSLRKVKINRKRPPIPQSQDRFEIKLNLGNLLHFLFIEEVSNFCHNF